MDKILAFSILSSSPADISAASGFSTRLSWRPSAGGSQKQQHHRQAEEEPKRQQEKAAEQQGSRPAAVERKARFALEFDGINCFESIVSF
ncbi:hypothetical protein BAE44_0005387 [Dichanthelium oligosanthes]|uniref:Uncharacterized protein n=1 Tax=Dichanthelium oligosanthes TaxID=888268 RepID=A0A1E5W8B7_9POAL|nr:hypothetical protein BAE44_0005387 [Dichanthelium oligosanthes]